MTAVHPFNAVTDPLPTGSLALEASAGTGKTWTLTAITVRVVLETDLELPELLLVTFTRAATAELRDRVRRRLTEVARALDLLDAPGTDHAPDGDDLVQQIVRDIRSSAAPDVELARRRERLRRALSQLDEATISTIHGFCQSMLHHAALEAGIDFDAVLLDDDADLVAEVVDDHLARELRPAEPDAIRYLQQAGGVDRARLLSLARSVAALPSLQLRPHPHEHGHLDADPGGLTGVRPEARQSDGLSDDLAGDLQLWSRALEHFRVRWQEGGRDRALALPAQLTSAAAWANPRQTTFTPNKAAAQVELVDRWLTGEHPLPPPPPPASKGVHLAAAHPYAWFSCAALAPKLASRPDATPLRAGTVLTDDPLVAAADALWAAVYAPATRFLLRTARVVWDELDRRKRQRTVLTFDDLLRRLDAALRAPTTREQVRHAIRQRYRFALIDEFQDTDPIQWRIFSSVFDVDEPLVLIGDPKQAIYGFRGADINTYVRARDSRPTTATLRDNHRSDRSFVAACNRLFGVDGAFATPDIPYHPVAHVREDRLIDPDGGAALTLRFLQRSIGGVGPRSGGLLTKGSLDRRLPTDVAAVAVELLQGRARVPDGNDRQRGLEPRDLAVLVRTNRRALAVQAALQAAGVPAVIQRGGSVYDSEEAEAVQRLLAAMLRPSSQPQAAAAAASVLGGRDAARLAAELAAVGDDAGGDPGGGADGAPGGDPGGGAGGDPAAARSWDAWVDALSRWGARWSSHGVLAALQQALDEDGVAARLLAREDGDRRLTNLRHLLELLHTAERADGLAPHVLLSWLAARRQDAAEGAPTTTDTELRLEEDAEAVRVVTVHGSKGLQYPVVLCPDLWDGRDQLDESITRFHDPEVSDPAEAVALDLDADASSASKRRSIALARAEIRTEQLRLAYVALTRAEHRAVVWWGAITSAPTSALASLLHGRGAADPEQRLELAAQRVADAGDTELLTDLEELVVAGDRAIGVERVEALPAPARWQAPGGEEDALVARPWTRGALDRSWRRTSFTALVRGAATPAPAGSGPPVSVDAGRDVDAEVAATTLGSAPPDAATVDATGGEAAPAAASVLAAPAADAATAAAPEVPLARFPRGAAPGTFLHDVLEHLDLTRVAEPAHRDAVIAHQATRHGIDGVHLPSVATGLERAVETGLGDGLGGVRLCDLRARDRWNELRFELPMAGGAVSGGRAVLLPRLGRLLADSADPLIAAYAEQLRDPALAVPVRGYLSGSIDLLARLPDGRFLVADYKSNWFGDRDTGRSIAADYRPAALGVSMVEHHYVLQALFYLVAAHRFLRWRVAGYDPAKHLAGAGYLFLRGMVGEPVASSGVILLAPEPALVDALSRELDGGAG